MSQPQINAWSLFYQSAIIGGDNRFEEKRKNKKTKMNVVERYIIMGFIIFIVSPCDGKFLEYTLFIFMIQNISKLLMNARVNTYDITFCNIFTLDNMLVIKRTIIDTF